jgi:hypothetical protein
VLENRQVVLAVKTLAAIDTALEKDQGNLFRHFLEKVIPHIGDAFRQDDGSQRTHLGASILGGDCGRSVWMSFRWFTKKKFDGRILRLFSRGHLEEARFIALLLMIGVQVFQQDANGNQYRISFAEGHGGGSGDGVGIGVPDVPDGTATLLEFKTHGEKSYLALAKVGVREAKFEHYVQMQLYMGKMGLPVALYGAVNKNTDHLHLEIITFNQEVFNQFIDRGEKFVEAKEPPPKINNSPGFYKCSYCDHKMACHFNKQIDPNCRTCIFSEPRPNNEWLCTHPKRGNFLTKEDQAKGCEDRVAIKL